MTRRIINSGTALAILTVMSCSESKGSYSLTNVASEPIASASITVCKQRREFRNVQPGHSVPGCYVVRADDHFIIDIKFESGKTLRKESGYVASGLDFQHEIVVTDSDVQLVLLNSEFGRTEPADSIP
jgi:hypothetical protein